MTQAMNLANFSNSLDSAGGVPPTQLNSVVPISKGGTNASTASAARTSLGSTTVGDAVFIAASQNAAQSAMGVVVGTNVPSPTGTGASGTWAINITGNAATATSATSATSASTATLSTNATNMLGYTQSWTDVSSSRVIGTTYTNSSGKAIEISVTNISASQFTAGIAGFVNTVQINSNGYNSGTAGTGIANLTFVVPDGATYKITLLNTSTSFTWFELR